MIGEPMKKRNTDGKVLKGRKRPINMGFEEWI
jgi:hypothetical protein